MNYSNPRFANSVTVRLSRQNHPGCEQNACIIDNFSILPYRTFPWARYKRFIFKLDFFFLQLDRMRLFVEQTVLKSPRVWLTSVTATTTAWASWCSFNERCLSEDHICKLLYKITIFHEFIKQSLFWNGWGVVPISAAQNRHLFELKGGKKNQPKAYYEGVGVSSFLYSSFPFLWQTALCLYTTSSIDSRRKMLKFELQNEFQLWPEWINTSMTGCLFSKLGGQ